MFFSATGLFPCKWYFDTSGFRAASGCCKCPIFAASDLVTSKAASGKKIAANALAACGFAANDLNLRTHI